MLQWICEYSYLFELVFSFPLDVTADHWSLWETLSDHGVEVLTSSPTSVMLGLSLATVVSLTLAAIVLGLTRRHWATSHPVCPLPPQKRRKWKRKKKKKKNRSGITRLYDCSIFKFWRISILFSIVAVPIYIPTKSTKGFPFLHILLFLQHLLFLVFSFV